MTKMKRYVLIIGLWAAFVALPSEANAQWSFTATIKTSGKCDNYTETLPRTTGIPTRAECEALRSQIASIRVSGYECTAYYVCTPCTGQDIAGGNSGSTSGSIGGNANPNGTNQGSSYYTGNPYEATQDAYEQKQLQNEALLKKGKRLYYGDGRTPSRVPFDNARASVARGTANANGKTFEWHGGRAGALGGFNIRPGAPAARYNGQMGAFGLGGVITPENRSQHIHIAQPGTINEQVERYQAQEKENIEANFATGAEQGTALPMSNGITVPEDFIDLSSIFETEVHISKKLAENITDLDDLQNLFINIANQAADNQTKAGENKEAEKRNADIRDKASNMAQKIGSIINSTTEQSKNDAYYRNLEEVQKYEDVFHNFECKQP
jgi:hypothetical protein